MFSSVNVLMQIIGIRLVKIQTILIPTSHPSQVTSLLSHKSSKSSLGSASLNIKSFKIQFIQVTSHTRSLRACDCLFDLPLFLDFTRFNSQVTSEFNNFIIIKLYLRLSPTKYKSDFITLMIVSNTQCDSGNLKKTASCNPKARQSRMCVYM